MPASSLPSVAQRGFFCGFLPGTPLSLFQGQIKLATDSIHNCHRTPRRSHNLVDFKTARLIKPCIPSAVPFQSHSLCSIPCAAIRCVLSVCGEFFFSRGTCNQLLSGREQRTLPGGCIDSPAPLQTPCVVPQYCLLPMALGWASHDFR